MPPHERWHALPLDRLRRRPSARAHAGRPPRGARVIDDATSAGWTGGQYSLYRVALAGAVAASLAANATALAHDARSMMAVAADRPFVFAVAALGFACMAAATVALALGSRDSLAAMLLAPGALAAEAVRLAELEPPLLDAFAGRTALLLAVLLVAHGRTPAAPFGSLDARGRTDPRGGWERPARHRDVAWALLAIVLAARTVQVFATSASETAGAPLAAGFALVCGVAGLTIPRARPSAWTTLVLFGWACLVAFGPTPGDGQLALLAVYACEPAWWPGRSLVRASDAAPASPSSDRLPARLFYDGDCGFCHRSVRFVLAEELATPAALRLRFAPLASETFRARLAAHPEQDPAKLPDSIVLETEGGELWTRSRAALEIASRLGGFWRMLALAGRLVPPPLLDTAYDAIARVRKRLFVAPKDACPILPPDLRARFDS